MSTIMYGKMIEHLGHKNDPSKLKQIDTDDLCKDKSIFCL